MIPSPHGMEYRLGVIMYARVAASVAAGGGPANATGRRTSAIPRRRAGPCRRIPLAAGYGVVWQEQMRAIERDL